MINPQEKSNVDFKPQPKRVVIEKVTPQIDGGLFPIKRVVGEWVVVRANVFADGHDDVDGFLLFKTTTQKGWQEVAMKPLGNDRWVASFVIEKEEDYLYSIRGCVNEFSSWRKVLEKRREAGQDLNLELKVGLNLIKDTLQRANEGTKQALQKLIKSIEDAKNIDEAVKIVLSEDLLSLMSANLDLERSFEYPQALEVSVERKLAAFSSWYEFFPRSWCSKPGKHGTFKDCERILPEIARMGFDIIYLPPIHPIGQANRKGKNNSVKCEADDVGCPWAIGSKDGGHKAIETQLGTLEDFKDFIKAASKNKLEVALDLAYQCSPDHPYVKEHPSWFKWRPDGTVQFAENAPKKYEDVLPINFESEDWQNLWEELKSIVLYWVEQGVKIFRVDNPHTKPFPFWDWLISEVRKEYPDAIFLAEAFTRPKVMYRLAKAGFSQSYTYFTWRNTKQEFIDYLTELSQSEVAEYFRPNFWPNTPDILPEHLQYGGRASFIMRAVLAATLSSNFGIYGPAFELCVSEPLPGKEEYADSEKYEIKKWDWDQQGNLKEVLARLNKIRRENSSLQVTRNVRFLEVDNDHLLCYYKATGDFSNVILVVVNLDPYHNQVGWLKMPLSEIGIESNQPYLAHDLLSGDKFIWQGETSYLQLDPQRSPAHIILIKRHLHREQDFDYFM